MSKEFELVCDMTPAGDQPQAIRQLVEGLQAGLAHQTLLGVTGSGKTFFTADQKFTSTSSWSSMSSYT